MRKCGLIRISSPSSPPSCSLSQHRPATHTSLYHPVPTPASPHFFIPTPNIPTYPGHHHLDVKQRLNGGVQHLPAHEKGGGAGMS